MFAVGDVVIPKKEWLDPGEIAEPVIVLDAWDSPEGERIATISVDEAEQIANKTLKGFPHSRFDTFSEYYELYEG